MDLDVEKKEWESLVRQTRQRPFFKNIGIVHEGHESTLLVESIWPKVIRMFFHMGVIAVIVYYFSRDDHIELSVLGCMILPFLPVVISPLMPANRIRIENLRSGIILRYGNIVFPRVLKLYRDQLRIGLSNADQNRTLLILQKRNDPDSVLVLARGYKSQTLENIYQELKKYLSSDSVQEPREQSAVQISNNVPTVSRSSISKSTANFKTAKLTVTPAKIMTITPTAGAKMIWWGIIGAGVGIMIFLLPDALHRYTMSKCLILGGVGGLFGLVGIAGVLSLRTIEVRQDLRRITIASPDFRILRKVPACFSFEDIAAVQICSQRVQPNEGRDYTAYEVNLVLHTPPGERVHLFGHAKENDLKADARQLADFLNVPLLDHSEISGL
jgi:hypothetical protein